MKRVILIAALAALAVPLAASAHDRRPRHPHPAPSATRNAAWACKSLRAADASAFAHAYGANGTLRDAYGRCVAVHARSVRHGRSTVTLHGTAIGSTGTVTNAGAAGCQTSAAGCALTSTGTLTGVVGGTYTSSWTILWTQATSNGAGGYCAPATGTTTLSLPALGTLTTSDRGTVCEVGATGTNVEHVLKDGTFTVSSGTGVFAGATGSGTEAFDQKPGASTALGGTVTGVDRFDRLALTIAR